MKSKGQNNQEERILVLAPTGRDGAMTARFLSEAGLYSEVCIDFRELCSKISQRVGLVFLTGEALTLETMSLLSETLHNQPPWSDVPLIVLTSGGGENPANSETIEELSRIGNVTLIERPVRLMTLMSAIKSGLRARRKQYEARDFLAAEINAKEELRQSEERLRVALDAGNLGAWQLDLKTQKLECTDICKANFGLSPETNFSYSQLLSAIHEDDRERVSVAVQHALENRENYRAEYRIRWQDGTEHWILATGVANYGANGNPYNMVGVTLDITERKLAEKEREKLLEREHAARTAAESANRLKDEFLATVSHELRTPLNAILGWTNILHSGRLKPEEGNRALETILRNARMQAEIIEDLLDVSRIISGKLTLQITLIEPVSLINDVIESLKPAADAKKITVSQTAENELSGVMGDPARIQQIIWNLLSNAIKFTPSGGNVEIKLKVKADEHLIISVSDTGDGIEPEFLPFVFDRFLQADGTTTRTHGGLGLGLAIVRHLIELHGGTVRAKSDGKNRGATFTVQLPLVQKQEQNSNANGHAPVPQESLLKNDSCRDLSGLKVLVVDDEADSLELIKTFLEHCGAHVMTANSVDDALKHFNGTAPDVLISDIGMPKTDGYEFIKKVRQFPSEKGGEIPAVALTAYARSEDKTRALRSGFQTHLSKPIEVDELIRAIATVAGRK